MRLEPRFDPSEAAGFEALRQDRSRFRGNLKVNPNERLFMEFVSLKAQNKLSEPSRVTVKDFNSARVAFHEIHAYTELRQQIHHDLRVQHPEWIEPSGESPMCDFYEARLMELLGAESTGLS